MKMSKKIVALMMLVLTIAMLLPVSTMAHTESDPFVADLIAGGGNVKSQIDAGDVSIWNDSENLYVKYETDAPWCLLSTELHVGDALADIPQNKESSPQIGHFEYKNCYTLDPCVTEHVYTISLADHDLVIGEDVYIAAHANVMNPSLNCQETAWGQGTKFNNKNWSMYITYTIQESVIYCTVTFDKNGGDTEASPTTATTTYGGTVTLPTTNPTKAGYFFNNWNTEADGGGDVFTNITPVVADITVYAQWTLIPTPGADIVVFNDINPFDNTGMADPNNVLMVQNLINFTNPNPRGSGTVVLFDRGRNCSCNCAVSCECQDAGLATMRSVITGAGYSITDIYSTSGSITSIDSGVKVMFLWNPMVPYTTAEINVFKQFAAEGGRLIFIGEWDNYYGSGIDLENQFLLDMGAVMTNIGDAVDCGYTVLPATSLRPHQITDGMTDVTIACASVIVPGPQDYPLFYDSTNTVVLAGVAKIDTTPLP